MAFSPSEIVCVCEWGAGRVVKDERQDFNVYMYMYTHEYLVNLLNHPVFFTRGELPLLEVWKNALQLFVWNKHLINKKHEFAIVILNEKAQWVSAQHLGKWSSM